jgi:hypothetical protein
MKKIDPIRETKWAVSAVITLWGGIMSLIKLSVNYVDVLYMTVAEQILRDGEVNRKNSTSQI